MSRDASSLLGRNLALTKDYHPNRFLIMDLCNPLSLGGAAIVVSLIRLLENQFPKSQITCMVSRERDRTIYQQTYGLPQVYFLSHLWYREKETRAKTVLYSFPYLCFRLIKAISSSLLGALKISIVDPFVQSDVIIDLNSDALNEHYGIVYPMFTLLNILLASLSRKPVIVAPCSIGTFRNPFTRRFASFVLNRTQAITVRELISKENLDLLNVSRPRISFSSDLAFLFEPEGSDETRKKLARLGIDTRVRPLIGITPSQIIHYYAFQNETEPRSEKRRKYIILMAEIADFVVEKIGATVILVPHSYCETGDLSSYADMDDRDACRDIYVEARNKDYIKTLNDMYGADEIKGLIGSCNIFIACRMHASIAATSQYIPTVVLSYGTKFEGVVGDLIHQKDQIVDIGGGYDVVLAELKAKTLRAWEDRQSIRRNLSIILPRVKDSSRSFAAFLHFYCKN